MLTIIHSELRQAYEVLDAFIHDQKQIEAIERAAIIMIECIKNGGTIYSCGNGGSLSDAVHFASELTGRYRKTRPAIPAIAISDPGHLSCVANDFGYENVFSRFIEAHGKPGDVLLALTTSGKSHNVVDAIQAALDKRMRVVVLTGALVRFADVPVTINTPHHGTADRTQEIHIIVIHILVSLIEKGLGYEK